MADTSALTSNAKRTLETPLPDPTEIRRSFGHEALAMGSRDGGSAGYSLGVALEILGGDYASHRRHLAEMLGVSEDKLSEIADGCGDELASHAMLNQSDIGGRSLETSAVGNMNAANLSERLRKRIQGS